MKDQCNKQFLVRFLSEIFTVTPNDIKIHVWRSLDIWQRMYFSIGERSTPIPAYLPMENVPTANILFDAIIFILPDFAKEY